MHDQVILQKQVKPPYKQLALEKFKQRPTLVCSAEISFPFLLNTG